MVSIEREGWAGTSGAANKVGVRRVAPHSLEKKQNGIPRRRPRLPPTNCAARPVAHPHAQAGPVHEIFQTVARVFILSFAISALISTSVFSRS